MDKKIGFRSLLVALAVAVLSIALSLETEAKKYDFSISAGYQWSQKGDENRGFIVAGQFHLPIFKGLEFAPELGYYYLKEHGDDLWHTGFSLRALAGYRIPTSIIEISTGPRMDIAVAQKSFERRTCFDGAYLGKHHALHTVVAYWQFRIAVGLRKYKLFFDYSLPISNYYKNPDIEDRLHLFEVGAQFTFSIGR